MVLETFSLAFTANGKPETRPFNRNKTSNREMFYLYELLIRINTLHIDRWFDHRHLLTDVNYFPAYMASRLNCGVSCLNSTIELLDMLIAAHYKRETSTRTSSD